MPTYRVEEAKTGRAGCTATECKKNKVKIDKGELRMGNLVEIMGNQSWQWKHWGCVTPQQLENWKDISDDKLDMVDGYEELPSDLQKKVKRSFAQGHVDDEDWKGDIEKNRPGQKGFFLTPAEKKAKEGGEEGGDTSVPNSPDQKKKKPNKRKKPDEEEADDVKAEKPSRKNAKTDVSSSKKSKKSKPEAEAEDDEEMMDVKPVQSTRKSKPEDDAPTTAKKPKTSKANGGKTKSEDTLREEDTAADDNDGPPAKAPGRGRPKKKPEDKLPAKPKSERGRGRPRKVVVAADGSD